MNRIRFVGLDIHKERISIAVAECGRAGWWNISARLPTTLMPSTSYAIVWGVPASRWRFAMRARPVRLWRLSPTHKPGPSLRRGGAIADSE